MEQEQVFRLVDGKVCTVFIDGGETFRGIGSAVCHPDDPFDEELGLALAEARAYQDLGARITLVGKNAEKAIRKEVARRDYELVKQTTGQAEADRIARLKREKFDLDFATLIEALHPGTFQEQKPWPQVAKTMIEDFVASSRA